MKTISQLRDWLIANGFQATRELWHKDIYGGFIMENNKMRLFFTPCYQLKRAELI